MKQIKLDSKVMNSPTKLWLSQKFTYYRWFADRANFDFLKYLTTKVLAGKT